jgi:hypothetical protein
MRRSTDWYRQQSALAERAWQRAVWGGTAPRKSTAKDFHPHRRLDGQPAPDSIASRIYPHLSEKKP